jgi:hypothetical protein
VAPGTPPDIIRKRIQTVDDVLTTALQLLENAGGGALASGRGSLLFDRTGVSRCIEFQRTLKSRFAADLKILGAEFSGHDCAEAG